MPETENYQLCWWKAKTFRKKKSQLVKIEGSVQAAEKKQGVIFGREAIT